MFLLFGNTKMKYIYNLLLKLRSGFSKVCSIFYKKTKEVPHFTSKDQNLIFVHDFCINHYVWVSDPIYGLLDHIRPIESMNSNFLINDKIEGDCDDLSTYTCYIGLTLLNCKTYRINIFTMKHVIAVLNYQGKYYWSSNEFLNLVPFNTLNEAVSNYINPNDMWSAESLTLKNLA